MSSLVSPRLRIAYTRSSSLTVTLYMCSTLEWTKPVASVFAIRNGIPISRETFFFHVLGLSQRLPDKEYAINLCEDRYIFCVAFLALLIRGGVNLLPPNKTTNAIAEITSKFPNAYCIVDRPKLNFGKNIFSIDDNLETGRALSLPELDVDRPAAFAFTSGSTGEPKRIIKSWRELITVAQLVVERFRWQIRRLTVVATVPPQHMYGLETSVFWPFCSQISMSSGRPFYVEDIRTELAASPTPGILVSTPAHLKICVESDLEWRNVSAIMSSTAPMSLHLARQIETSFAAPLVEMYGCSETLSFASRRITEGSHWKPYRGINLLSKDEGFYLQADHIAPPAKLDDVFDISADGMFSVLGRSADMVKVAGKRASLADLNLHLNTIEGVKDGVFFVPDGQSETQRLGALVVSDLPKKEILRTLRRSIDEVLLPRPLHIIEALPRNKTGKLEQHALMKLISDLKNGRNT